VIAQTKDHSVVQNMVDAGYLKECELRTAQERSRLFAALGQEENFEPRSGPHGFSLVAGDVFLLCTDGFWEYLDESMMIEAIGQAQTPAAWLDLMVTRLRGSARPRHDNFTASAVWVGDASETTVLRMPA